MNEEPDDLRIDGEIINESFSTCAPHVNLRFLRYCRFRPEVSLLAKAFLVFAIPSLIALALRWWIAAVLLALPAIALACLLNWIRKRTAEIFQNALLTPAIVVSTKPLQFVSLANMDTGFGAKTFAVKRVSLKSLPSHPVEVGSRFPYVSGFLEGTSAKRWGDFDPQPLSFATGNEEILKSRMEKIGEESFAELTRLIKTGRIPDQPGKILFLDDQSPEATKAPPPIPPPPPPGR